MKTISQLRDELARQILEIALAEDNPQYKLDAFRATIERGKVQAPASPEEPVDTMASFMSRVKKAAETEPELNGADDADNATDESAAADRRG